MPLKSDYNHIICVMEGETKNIRFVLKIHRFVLRLLNISFCGLYSGVIISLPMEYCNCLFIGRITPCGGVYHIGVGF